MPVRVVADLAVPETKKLQKLEIFVNETRAATLFQPPFQQVVDVPRREEIGFLRVVATLEDGSVSEDVRYINAPKYLSEVDVQAVELYTSVFAKGRPVTGLAKSNFRVLEDGVEQAIDAFEVVTNLPLSLGIGVDTSGSMEETLPEAQKAANDFLRSVMTPRDRCFLVTFDNEPQLVSRFTTDRERLAQALAGLQGPGIDLPLGRRRLRPLPVPGDEGAEGLRHPDRRRRPGLEVHVRGGPRLRAQDRRRDLLHRAEDRAGRSST